MKAFVDKEACIGCELCTTDYPEIFSMEDDGLAVAIEAELSEDQVSDAQEAVDSCPTEAISVK